jgi:hypothetical protein
MTRLVHARWIPRRDRLAFNPSEGIYLVNADGSGFSLAIVNGSHPHWSPNPRSAEMIHRRLPAVLKPRPATSPQQVHVSGAEVVRPQGEGEEMSNDA